MRLVLTIFLAIAVIATMGFFPIDGVTLDYLSRTGRTDEEVQLVESYTKQQGLFRSDESPATA